jgi:hypothetical protein
LRGRARAGSSGRQEVFANRRKNVDQDNFFVKHGCAMRKVRWEVQDFTSRDDALLVADRKEHAAALNNRHLLVRVGVDRSDNLRCEPQTANRQSFAPNHLTLGSIIETLYRNSRPVGISELDGGFRNFHFFPNKPISE